MDVSLTLESFIYNERRGVWEPLIEPIHNCTGKYKPYSLNIKVIHVYMYMYTDSIMCCMFSIIFGYYF